MSLQRIMFLNYDTEAIGFDITTYENVAVFALLPDGEEIEEEVEVHPLPQRETSLTWRLEVPAGAIRGIGVYSGADFRNPDEEVLTVIGGSDKNPWPPPPPPPGLLVERSDFADRYAGFLLALSGEAPAGRRGGAARRRAAASGGA
jgi:hypothetical protein